MEKTRLEAVKEVIKKNINSADCGLFFTRNLAGDTMETIYEKDGVTVDICYGWAYFEVFGLTEEEQEELYKFYEALGIEMFLVEEEDN